MPHEETITIMQIRKANLKDMEVIMALIAEGRRKMIAEGNTHQWTEGHPARSVVEDDILRQDSYLMVNAAGTPVATFVLRKGPGPTYATIYSGAWLDDSPYYVIHRVASVSGEHGILRGILEHASRITENIRIDTHRDNKTMRTALEHYGFLYCGIIHLENGDERLAFQRVSPVRHPTATRLVQRR